MKLIRLNSSLTSFLPKRYYHYDGWWHPPKKNIIPHRKNTTALVLGWARSQPKHVETYTKLYANELGIGAHGYKLPMELAFEYDQDCQQKLAEKCLEVIGKQNSGKNVFIHCFSNNGFVFYQHVSKLLKENPYKLVYFAN